MDSTKLEEIDYNTNNDQANAEKPTCLLEENDTQCGHVFYNENTRLLKFFCTYCRETYDNIQYFCQHLSAHINDANEIEDKEHIFNEDEHNFKLETGQSEEEEEDVYQSTTSAACIEEQKSLILEKESQDSEFLSQTEEDTQGAFEYLDVDNENIDEDDYNEDEMIVEEIYEADEIRAEVEQEIGESLETGSLYLNNNSCSTEFIGYGDEDTTKSKAQLPPAPVTNLAKIGSSFEDCFIKETNIDKIRTEGVSVIKEHKTYRKSMQRRRTNFQDVLRLRRRRKKVTTVKVIAVKNRIAELYERIQSEKEKSQQIFSNTMLQHDVIHPDSLCIDQQEQETQDAIESLIKDEIIEENQTLNSNNIEEAISSNKEITRQIIGETLITLIPEGTKIPHKLPSPVRDNISITEIPPEKRSFNTGYHHHQHHNESNTNDKKAVCPACGKTFRSHFSLTIHKRIHYLESDSNVKLAHKCSDCDQLFNKLTQLKHHVETVHYPEGFICKICNRKLSSLSLLERHMVKVHLDRPFNCTLCNKNFSDPITFEEHLASHNSGEVFKCSTCGRKYATEYFLMEHMRNHKEQIPQTCVVCGKVTLRITQHMKIHTPRPKRLLSCSVCGKVFNFSSGLSHHFKIMHKLPRPPPKPKRESNPNAIKRKRKPKTSDRLTVKKKQDVNSSTEASFVLSQDKFDGQIIEEQIEIPHEVYDTTPQTIMHLENQENLNKNLHLQQSNQVSVHEHHINDLIHQHASNHHQHHHSPDVEEVNHKEEEAKRVIVELIQNSTYTSFFPDNLSSVLEVTPPIAREETISAVNSIVHDC